MANQENKKIVEKVFSYFGSGDIQSLLTLLSPDVEWSLPDIKQVPIFRTYKGREEVLNCFMSIAQSQEVLQFDVKEVIADGSTVAVLGFEKWKVRSTQKIFETDWVHIYTIRENEIAAVNIYGNTAKVLEAYQESVGSCMRRSGL